MTDPRKPLDALIPMARKFLDAREDDRSRYLKFPALRERVAEDGRGEASVRAVAFVVQLNLADKAAPTDDSLCELCHEKPAETTVSLEGESMNVCPTCEGNALWFLAWMGGEDDPDSDLD